MSNDPKQMNPEEELEIKPTEEVSVDTEEAMPEVAEVQEEKSEWQVKAEEYLNDLKRVQADFENYKKRQQAEAKEFSSHLAKSIVTDLIPVLDNLHAASEHVPADLTESPWVKGITYIEKQFEDALKNYGVEPIEVKVGDKFNPIEHEAVDQKNEDGKVSEHKIEKVLQKGYKVGDRVIKAARVIVS
jgi:molecular chaperone GrpE